MTCFMQLEGATGNLPRNSHTLNALTYQADCAYKTPHNSNKSSLSNSFLWLLNVHPELICPVHMVKFLYDLGVLGPSHIWLCNYQL